MVSNTADEEMPEVAQTAVTHDNHFAVLSFFHFTDCLAGRFLNQPLFDANTGIPKSLQKGSSSFLSRTLVLLIFIEYKGRLEYKVKIQDLTPYVA